MAVWETVEAVERHVEALDAETRDVLQPVLHRLVRLRGLHESTLPQEQQLRRTHVALVSEQRLYAEKLRAIHFHAQTAAMGEAALGALRRRGFVNYYGLQRFGESAARNDEVGKHLLLGEYALAVDALLRPRPEDKPRGAESWM